jgi:hypothetical protein
MSAGGSLTLEFDMLTNAPSLSTAVAVDAVFAFTTANGARVSLGTGYTGAWESRTRCVITLSNVLGASPAGDTRIGYLLVSVLPSGGVVSADTSSAPASTAGVLVGGGWGNCIRAIVAGPLSTAGGQLVVLVLSSGLGPGAAHLVASASCRHGGVVYAAGSCSVLDDGTGVQCVSVPGVGVGHQWQLNGTGLATPWSVATTSYAPPVIFTVAPAAAVPQSEVGAAGGTRINITGANFGPLGAGYISHVTCSPAAFPAYVFRPRNCAVVTADTLVQCDAGAAMGDSQVFSFQIAGQNTTQPALSIAPPSISGVRAVVVVSSSCGFDLCHKYILYLYLYLYCRRRRAV